MVVRLNGVSVITDNARSVFVHLVSGLGIADGLLETFVVLIAVALEDASPRTRRDLDTDSVFRGDTRTILSGKVRVNGVSAVISGNISLLGASSSLRLITMARARKDILWQCVRGIPTDRDFVLVGFFVVLGHGRTFAIVRVVHRRFALGRWGRSIGLITTSADRLTRRNSRLLCRFHDTVVSALDALSSSSDVKLSDTELMQ